MRMKNSLFDFRYFRYTVKRMLPYSLVMLLVLILSSFLIFGLSEDATSFSIGNLSFIGVELLGITANVGMYIIPIALCIGMFGFLHKKNYADFILSSPVKRSSVFFTNIISGLVIISAILAFNLMFTAFVIYAGPNHSAYVAVGDYFLSFFYNLAGYMLVFSVSSFAAVITGTAISQAYMTFIILFLPTFLLSFIEFPYLIQPIGNFIGIQYTIPLNSIILLPNITTFPITDIMLSASGSRFSEFYGFHRYFSASAICYTFLFAIIYAVLGIIIFRKYKTENAGNSFVNKGIGVFAYAGSFGPVMLLCFLIFAQDDYLDMIDSPLFYIFIVLSFVSFIIISLIFNKGFSGFGKQISLYFILIVCTAVVSGTLNLIADHSVQTFDIRTEDIKSVSVYMRPINAHPINDINVSQNYIKVKIDDPQIISLMTKGSDSGEDYFCDFSVNGGKNITLCARLTDEFISGLYQYIDDNIDIKKTLIFLPGAKNIVSTGLSIETVSGQLTYSSAFAAREGLQKIISEREMEYLDIPLEKLYSNTNYRSRYLYNYQQIERLNYGLIDYGSVKFVVSALRNKNGMYYFSNYNIDYDSSFYYGFAKESHERANDIVPRIDNQTKAHVAGTFNLETEQYMLLQQIVPSLPYVMTSDFIAAVKQTIKEPIYTDNTIAVAITTDKLSSIVFMDIERDLKPLIDVYLDKVIETLEKQVKNAADSTDSPYASDSKYYYNGETFYREGVAALAFGAMFGNEINDHTEFFDSAAFDISLKEIIDLIKENKKYINDIITSKHSKESLESEYYFLSILLDYNNRSGAIARAVIPITPAMMSKISSLFNYFEVDANLFDVENIDRIEAQYYKTIEDKNDIDYLTLLLKDNYFRKSKNEMSRIYGGFFVFADYDYYDVLTNEIINADFIYKDKTEINAQLYVTNRASSIFVRGSDGE